MTAFALTLFGCTVGGTQRHTTEGQNGGSENAKAGEAQIQQCGCAMLMGIRPRQPHHRPLRPFFGARPSASWKSHGSQRKKTGDKMAHSFQSGLTSPATARSLAATPKGCHRVGCVLYLRPLTEQPRPTSPGRPRGRATAGRSLAAEASMGPATPGEHQRRFRDKTVVRPPCH